MMNTCLDSPSPTTLDSTGHWRRARHLLLAAAALVTLVAGFYTVENWRGKRAWENCRHALEARGELLDWAAYIPAPVPDAENFYKAPHMDEWFVKRASLSASLSAAAVPANGLQPFTPAPRKDTNVVLADVTVLRSKAPLDMQRAAAVLRLEDPSAREQATKLLKEALGPCVIGARMDTLVAQPLNQFKPVHLVLQADTPPTLKELAAFFPSNLATNAAAANSSISYLQLDAAGSNSFRLSLKPFVYGAADYLAWTEPLTSNFELLRQALERPYARIDCDYEPPFAIAIPNFVQIRTVAQTLSERAQCHLLLGQSEAAWRELDLIHALCQILGPKPPGKPETLVAAMINVAITGVYASVVQDGFRLHAWREPQLQAIQQQVKTTDLLSLGARALAVERASACWTLESTKPAALVKLFHFGEHQNNGPAQSGDALATLALTAMPRGWYYQNMAVYAQAEQDVLGSLDATNQLVRPREYYAFERAMEVRLAHYSPSMVFVAKFLPNYIRALQTLAANQTLVNQAAVACALERYRLAQGRYPETLDALAPQFLDQLPHDLMGGQPLRYRRTDGSGYLLYSLGWNEKDDGGLPGKSREEGDWVWELH